MVDAAPYEKKPIVDHQAERNLFGDGPCGKLLNAMHKDGPPTLDLLFLLDACFKQRLDHHNEYNKERRLKMETVLFMFGDPGPNAPQEALEAREKAHIVHWVKKMEG